MYEIHGDIRDFYEFASNLESFKPAMLRASVRALNRTASSCKVKAAKLISADYSVTQKAVKDELRIEKANFNKLTAEIRGVGSPGIPLYKFKPTPNRVPSTIHKKGRWNVRTMIINGRLVTKRVMDEGSDIYLPKVGMKVMVTRGNRKVIKGAFLAKMKSGHVGLFRRAKDGRWGLRSKRQVIEELFGPSPLRLIEQERYQIALDDHADEVLQKEMKQQAEFYLKKYRVFPQ